MNKYNTVLGICRGFATQSKPLHKNLNNMPLSFKSKINNFMKSVHPDVLGAKCPKEFRVTNEKSVGELNNYLDCLEKAHKFQNVKIEFYVAVGQSDNPAEADFEKLSLNLEEISANSPASSRISQQLNFNKALEGALLKIKRLKHESPKDRERVANYFRQEEFEEAFGGEEENLEPVKKMKSGKLISDFEKISTSTYLKDMLKLKQYRKIKNNVAEDVDKAIHNRTDFFGNRRKADPIARQLSESLMTIDNLKFFEKNYLPPQLVFFDEKLEEEEIAEFMYRITLRNYKNEERYQYHHLIKQMVNLMCDPSCIIRLHITDGYSYERIPGYLSIPFHFELMELWDYFNQNTNQVYRVKKRFLEENKAIESAKNSLLKNFDFRQVTTHIDNSPEHTTNLLKLHQDVQLNIKRLNKFLTENFGGSSFNNFEISIFTENKNNELIKIDDDENIFRLNIHYQSKPEVLERMINQVKVFTENLDRIKNNKI